MGFFSRFFKNRRPSFSDEDRELSAQIRQQKAELSRLKNERDAELHKLRTEKEKLELQAEIADIRDELYGDDDEQTPDSIVLGLLSQFLLKQQEHGYQAQKSQGAAVAVSPNTSILTDKELRDIWENLPIKTKAVARNVSDDTLRSYIKTQIPGIDEQTLEKAILIVRGD
jgi:hypothetical protein